MKNQRHPAVGGVLWRAAAASIVLLLAGCSSLDVPRADNYPATDQKKARAVHHWDVLADDVASRVAGKISAWPPGEYPIYVAPSAGDTSFNNGFRKLLITRLLDRGVTLSTQPTAVTLTFETQLVQHEARVVSMGPMPWTRLALGVGVARDWHLYHQSAGSMLGGIVALGAITDLTQYAISGAAAGGPTRTEVLITTSLESADRYLARTADVYYIEQDDSGLYKAKAPEPPPPMPPPPTPMKTWRVVAP
ncbi:hypothetical protein ASF11_20330 [Acidovorax sp. Leaf76]|uniref:hypothetical protein n=1 Tax=unclassified Acidovorax TaxID=2684926 RepID=UPI0006F4F949|nr:MULTISPECIES: hypothetical protein [unclassified Acidovorax]KQO24683.1 hypothetical protein ASF11_20330 [Acidovorax sp. Leaf76]KQO39688.1 hypothetical protein ASF19_18265 [Acidovorax sp. Leaf84]KQS24977.1 hypothetical protein ASG27_19680 [Acidovorax sp. Leaf191]